MKPFTGFSFCKRRFAHHHHDRSTVDPQNPETFWSHYRHRHHHRHGPPAAILVEGQLFDAQVQPLTVQTEKSCHKHWHQKFWEKRCNKGKTEAVIEPAKDGN